MAKGGEDDWALPEPMMQARKCWSQKPNMKAI